MYLKTFVQKTALSKPFSSLYMLIYRCAVWTYLCAAKILLTPRSVYLKWGLDHKGFVAGFSDLDMIITIANVDAQTEFRKIQRFFKLQSFLQKILPLFDEFNLIATEKTIKEWLTCGDMWACELPDIYKPLYGEALPKGKYHHRDEKFILDCTSSAYYHYRNLLQFYLNQPSGDRIEKIAARNVFKFFVDTLRYCYYITQNKYIHFETRFDFFDFFCGTYSLPKQIKECFYRLHRSSVTIDDLRLIPPLLAYLTEHMEITLKPLAPFAIDTAADKRPSDTSYHRFAAHVDTHPKIRDFDNFARVLSGKTKTAIQSIFSYPYCLYVMVGDSTTLEEKHALFINLKDTVSQCFAGANNLKVGVLTGKIYYYLAHTMQFRLYAYGNEYIIFTGEMRENISARVLKMTMTEHVYYLRVVLGRKQILNKEKHLSLLCNGLLPSLLLALEKNYIAGTQHDITNRFREYYPELSRELARLGPLSDENRRKTEKIRLAHYIFARKLLDKLYSVIEKK